MTQFAPPQARGQVEVEDCVPLVRRNGDQGGARNARRQAGQRRVQASGATPSQVGESAASGGEAAVAQVVAGQ